MNTHKNYLCELKCLLLEDISINEISRILKVSTSKIKTDRIRYNLERNKNRTRGHCHNKKYTKSICLEAASKCKTKDEFMTKYRNEYLWLRRRGMMHEINFLERSVIKNFPEFVIKNILTECIGFDVMFNTRTIIPPYELDAFIPSMKIGIEYDGHTFHKNREDKDEVKSELCRESGITLIRIKEKHKNNKNKVIDNILYEISKHIDISKIKNIDEFKKQTIEYALVTTSGCLLEDALSISKNYETSKEFRKNHKTEFELIKSVDEKLLWHFEDFRKRSILISDEYILQIIKTYKTKSSFRDDHHGLYLMMQRNKEKFKISLSVYETLIDKNKNR